MSTSGLLLQWVVGSSIVLTFFSHRLIPYPDHKPLLRVMVPILWVIFWLGAGTWVTQSEKIKPFQHSWEGLQSISQLDFCDENPKIKQGMGKAAAEFGRLKLTLGRISDSPRLDEISKQDGGQEEEKVCHGRFADEPRLHFRYRLFLRHLNASKIAWDGFSLHQTLKHLGEDVSFRRNSLKTGIAKLTERLSVILQTGEKQTSFHQLWVENLTLSSKYPTGRDLATDLVSSNSPDWPFVLKLLQFLLPEPQRWKTDSLAPQLFSLPEKGFCEKVAKDPTRTAQTNSVWKQLQLFYEGCERRFAEFGKLPGECTPEKIRKSLTIACLERDPAGHVLRNHTAPLQWPGLPSTLHLATQTLVIPEGYFDMNTSTLPYRAYRLAYAIEQTLQTDLPLFLGENSAEPPAPLDFDRPQLLTAPTFELTRLEVLETINPLGPQELAPELQPYFWYDRFGPRIERFQRTFRRRLHKTKGALE